MLSRSRELWLALTAISLITLLYTGVVYRLGSIPAAQSFFGHSLGILGFLLMLMTETLYTLRKRSRSARWGKMANWLQFHIFTGLVGPFLVLLHTSWKFNGLAGVVCLLTAIIVLSGFIGRYIYTAVPRTADGVEVQAREIGQQIQRIEVDLAQQLSLQGPTAQALAQRLARQPRIQGSARALVLTRAFDDLSFRYAWWRERRNMLRTMDAEARQQALQLEQFVAQRRLLHQQMESLAAARRLLATWHAIHIPLGVALFTAAFVHIAAAIYYATLLH